MLAITIGMRLKTTSNRFKKKPLENLGNKPHEELIKIPKDVLSSWFKTLKINSKNLDL